MHEALFRYITHYANAALTGEEKELVKSAFLPKKLRKKQYLLQEGDICRHFGFLVKGAMRQYSFDDNI